MGDIAARRAAEALLAEHKANVRFGPLGPPDGPTTIPDAYDIQERYVALLRNETATPWATRSGLRRLRCRPFAGSIIPSGVSCSPGASIDRERPCSARISVGWDWNSKSPSASNRTSRSQPCAVPPK